MFGKVWVRRAIRIVAMVGVVTAAPLPALAQANPSCGNGTVDQNEECDGGPAQLHLDGDPANATCSGGDNCYFAFTCCKFNCQYVGTPGARCQDGNDCTGPDECNQVGECLGGPNAANDTPCDDQLFCNGAETCQDGECLSASDPCGEVLCQRCNEETDSCLSAVGVPCEDASACVTGGTCDGAGNCVGGTPNTEPCDDGLFCNGADTCSGGACSVHVGDPCSGPDGDGDCAESCDEAEDSCTAPDPVGVACDDGLFCTGSDTCDDGECAGHSGDPCTDPTGCNSTGCDEESNGCTQTPLPDGTACDDGELCTLDDFCTGGVCDGAPVLLEDLCPWTVVVREHPKADILKTDLKTAITGDICGGTVMIGNETSIESDVVSGEAAGTGVLRVKADALVGEDLVSAGGGAKGSPGSDNLPFLLVPAASLAPGSVTEKSDASGFWDLSGANPLAGACVAARNGYATAAQAMDSLVATASFPKLLLDTGTTTTIAPAVPGGVNVVDVDGIVKVGKDATLELSGGGDPETTVVLRIGGKLLMLLRGRIALTGGLLPGRTLVYVKGRKCYLGDETSGGGTLLCTPGRSRVRRGVVWTGVLYADGKKLRIGDLSSLTYAPFQAF